MRLDWKSGLFTDLAEAKQWIYDNPKRFDLAYDKNILELISTNKDVFDAFLGNREPVAVSFYYCDLDDDVIDSSEFFLIVSKFELEFVQGLWNFDGEFTPQLAKLTLFEKFKQINHTTPQEA